MACTIHRLVKNVLHLGDCYSLHMTNLDPFEDTRLVKYLQRTHRLGEEDGECAPVSMSRHEQATCLQNGLGGER